MPFSTSAKTCQIWHQDVRIRELLLYINFLINVRCHWNSQDQLIKTRTVCCKREMLLLWIWFRRNMIGISKLNWYKREMGPFIRAPAVWALGRLDVSSIEQKTKIPNQYIGICYGKRHSKHIIPLMCSGWPDTRRVRRVSNKEEGLEFVRLGQVSLS